MQYSNSYSYSPEDATSLPSSLGALVALVLEQKNKKKQAKE